MSLEFVEGFDHHQAILQKWDTISVPNSGFPGNNNIIVGPNFGRNGGNGARFSSSSNIGACWAKKNLPSNQATRYVGFAMFYEFPANSLINVEIVGLWDGATEQCSLYMTPAGKFQFMRNGFLGGSPTNIGVLSSLGVSFNQWHYIEIQVTISTTVGVANLWIDGVAALTGSSLNTQSSTNAFSNQLSFGVAGSANSYGSGLMQFWLDDVYVLNTTGSFNTSRLGDVKVQGKMPSGNGSTLNYTQNEATWVASTEMYLGQRVKDSNGNIQQVTAVTSDAKTGGSAPAWAVVAGNTTTDNHVTWTMLAASAQWVDVDENPPEGTAAWQQGTTYALGTAVWDSNGNLQLCTTAGSSSGSAPTWSTVIGNTTSDNTVVWTCKGPGEALYLSDATIGDISRFTYPAIVATNVYAVVCTMRARKDDSNVRSIRGDAKSGATVGDSGTDLPMSASYAFVQGFFESDPNTSAAWTQTAVNAAEFGVKTTA